MDWSRRPKSFCVSWYVTLARRKSGWSFSRDVWLIWPPTGSWLFLELHLWCWLSKICVSFSVFAKFTIFHGKRIFICIWYWIFCKWSAFTYVKLSNSLDLINPSSLLLGSIGSWPWISIGPCFGHFLLPLPWWCYSCSVHLGRRASKTALDCF